MSGQRTGEPTITNILLPYNYALSGLDYHYRCPCGMVSCLGQGSSIAFNFRSHQDGRIVSYSTFFHKACADVIPVTQTLLCVICSKPAQPRFCYTLPFPNINHWVSKCHCSLECLKVTDAEVVNELPDIATKCTKCGVLTPVKQSVKKGKNIHGLDIFYCSNSCASL